MFEKEIAAGVQVLNNRMPGWFNKINLDILDISDSDTCVIGQLGIENEYGDWNECLCDMNESLGFYDDLCRWDTLNLEWKKAISLLQAC